MQNCLLISVLVLAGLSGCGPSYSPDTYASNAAQQANKVEQGVVAGVRSVAVSAAGTIGAVSGAAAGGIAGSQVGVGPISAFTALGGSLVGGFGGSAVEHVTGDTPAFEYIVRKPNGDLVSVTQKDRTPLALGQKVLVISGTQARVVPDYTLPPSLPVAAIKADAGSKSTVAKPDGAPATEGKAGQRASDTDTQPADGDGATGKSDLASPPAAASPPPNTLPPATASSPAESPVAPSAPAPGDQPVRTPAL